MQPTISNTVAIFWDFENCRPSSSLSGNKVVDRIRCLVQELGIIIAFRAYIDVFFECTNTRAISLHSELQSSGLTLVHCPHNGKKDVADKMMIVDMLAFAIDNSAPSTIVIVTGDRDFTYAAAILRLRGYRVIVIAPPQTAHESLKLQADQLYNWQNDILSGSDTDVNSSSPVPRPADSTTSVTQQSSEAPPATSAQAAVQSSSSAPSLRATAPEFVPPLEPRSPPASLHTARFAVSSFSNPQPGSSVALSTNSPGGPRVANTLESPLAFNTSLFGEFREEAHTASCISRLQEAVVVEPYRVALPSFDTVELRESVMESRNISLSSRSNANTVNNEARFMTYPAELSLVNDTYSCPGARSSGSSYVDVESSPDGCTTSMEEDLPSLTTNMAVVKESTTVNAKQERSSSCLTDEADPRKPCTASLPTELDKIPEIIGLEPPSAVEQDTSPDASLTESVDWSSVPGPPTLVARQRFQTLITIFVERRASNRPTRILSSEVACEMRKCDPEVYEKAGVTKLKTFIDEARKARVIISPGLDKEGSTWVEIHPVLFSAVPAPPGRKNEPSSVSPPEKSGVPSVQVLRPSIDVVYTPLITRLRSEASPHRLLYSALGMFFRVHHPELYKRASVSGLSTYLQKAEKHGIVRIGRGDSPGSEWVELLPAYRESAS